MTWTIDPMTPTTLYTGTNGGGVFVVTTSTYTIPTPLFPRGELKSPFSTGGFRGI